ncbi:MAG: methyltransferase [Candidatus Micrarchaeota archaeon]
MDEQLERKIKDENRKLHNFSGDSYDNWPPYCTKKNDLMFFNDIKRIRGLLNKKLPIALECGCGTGKLTSNILKNGFNIHAIDISHKMIEQTKEKLNRLNFQKTSIKFHVSDVDEFLIESKYHYDLICFSAVLHHIGDYLKTLKTACKRVSRGGFIYIGGEPQLQKNKTAVHKFIDFISDKSIIGYKFLKNPKSSIRFIKKIILNPDKNSKINVALAEYHAGNGLDDAQIIKLLEADGFDVICYEEITIPPFAFFEILAPLCRDGTNCFKLIARKK